MFTLLTFKYFMYTVFFCFIISLVLFYEELRFSPQKNQFPVKIINQDVMFTYS